jgi:tyrosinase
MRIRKDVDNLTDTEQRRLISALTQLKALPDPAANYVHFASIHGRSCPHGCELFLPWHRAYIYEFETALRRFEPDVTLPYWDWTQTPKVPSLFSASLPNALYYERYTDQERHNMPNLHPLPTKADTDTVSKIPDFLHFGGAGEDTPWMGDLETIHGWPHLWTGDTMADIGFAACDPIFWSHHANVDRIWAKWQIDHPGSNPSNLMRSLDGLDGHWNVGDVLATSSAKLGYEYAVNVIDLPIDGNRIRGSRVSIRMSLPKHFEAAELRIENLMAHSRAPLQLHLFVNSGAPTFRLPLFGVHPHSSDVPMSSGVKPCFSPVSHQNPCGPVNIRKTIPASILGGHDSIFELGLVIASQKEEAITEIMFERAYILFT